MNQSARVLQHLGTGLRSAFACAVAFAGASCQLSPDLVGERDRASLGEAVYHIVHADLAASAECPVERTAVLEQRHDDFVSTIDHVVTRELENDLPELVGGAILPLVDSGELPRLTDAVADALGLLVDDSFDPERKVVTALAEAARHPDVLESEHALALVSGLFATGHASAGLHALAALGQEPDGVDDLAGSVLDLAARIFRAPAMPDTCGGGIDAAMLRADLLDTTGFVDDPALGARAWVARADRYGNPRVRIDPATGALFAPFVDGDGDRTADVDGYGRPIDASGAPIELSPLGLDGARDGAKRAVAGNGDLVYEYYDAKQTLLGAALRLVRHALDDRLHTHLAPIVDAVLGAPVACSDGTGTCYAYPSANHPLADVTFLLLEAARYDRAAVLAKSWAVALRQKPDLAERVLLALGDVIVTTDGLAPHLTTDELLGLVMDLSPLVSHVLETNATAHESLANLLVGVVGELGLHLGEARYQQVIVKLLPVLQALVQTGALATILELDQALQALPAVDGSGSVLAATMDGLAFLVRPRTVATRQGSVPGSSVAVELLRQLRVTFARVATAGATAHLDAVLGHALGYLTTRTMVGGTVHLADRNLVPTLAAALATLGHIADRPAATYACYVGQVQAGAIASLTGRNFATLVRIVRGVGTSPHGEALSAWAVEVLDPAPADPAKEAYGPLVAAAAGLVDSPQLHAALDQLLRFAGEVAHRHVTDGAALLGVLDAMIVADREQIVPRFFANLTAETKPGGPRAFSVLVDVLSAVRARRPDSMCVAQRRMMEPADLEAAVQSTVTFLRDEQRGLRAIYALIGQRPR